MVHSQGCKWGCFDSWDTKGLFLRSLALRGARQGPCEGHNITISTINGLHVCMEWYTHNLLLQFFTLCSSKVEVSETYFSDIVATHNAHTSCVK